MLECSYNCITLREFVIIKIVRWSTWDRLFVEVLKIRLFGLNIYNMEVRTN